MDSNTSVNIQQLKEMHSKLQNLNSNVTTAIGKSKEFHSKLEGKLQESLSKLQSNLDQSINTDRVQQSEKFLMDIHSHFEVKCTQIEEQNLNLVKRLRQMEKQEEEYKNQIGNLNSQLNEKGLKSHYQSQCNNQPTQTFSFKAESNIKNNNSNEEQWIEQDGEQQQEQRDCQLEESIYLQNEIGKLKKEIDILLQEKKKIMQLQQQNQQYLSDHQNSYFDYLYQSQHSTGSKNQSKANPVVVAHFQPNNLTNISQNASPKKKTLSIENYEENIEEKVTDGGRFSPQNKPKRSNNGVEIRLISPHKSQNKSPSSCSIHKLSPSRVGFMKSESTSKKQSENEEQKLVLMRQEIEQRVVIDYENKLQLANKELEIQRNAQLKQNEELQRERDVRIQMQLKLEEIEAEKRFQNILKSNERNVAKGFNALSTGESFSSPNQVTTLIDTSNQATLCHTPQRNIGDKNNNNNNNNNNMNSSNSKQSTNQYQNTLGYSPITEQTTSPNKQLSVNSYIQNESNSKFQPIHTTLKLNKVNNQSNTNESNYSYQMSVSPNRTTVNQHKLNNNGSNRSSQDSSQIQQQLIDIISKLQTSMSNKKRSLTPLKETQKSIETAKKFDYAIEDKLSQLKTILSQEQTVGNSNIEDMSSVMQSNLQSYQYNNSPVYTTEFISNH